jgi:exonuclease VII small subunit
MMRLAQLLCRLMWARLRRDEFAALAIWKEINMLSFESMDAAIVSIKTRLDADKAALDAANASLATAQQSVADAQASVDQRTAAITAALA